MTTSEIFDQSTSFAKMGLHENVLKGVQEAGFVHPTDIQARLIPLALAGHDILGQAKTGTGKTAAFGLPILHQADPNTPMQALILVPTRELAVQVAAEIEELGKHTAIRTSCIIGGESMRDQVASVRHGGHILVGTPGRVMDLEGRGQIRFDKIRFVVLDEVDRMLDIGFRDDIKRILSSIRRERQTMFVSATISNEIERLGRTYMKPDAQKIVTVSGSLTVSLVDQKHLPVQPWDKRTLLLHLLRHEEPDTTLVFCRTKATVDRIAKYLSEHGVDVRAIHGDLPQAKRTKVMDTMRQGKLDVLIASDLAARGIDIEHISHVINYDLPEDPEVYVHRIGRTARAGRRGIAWSFVTPEEGQRLTEIEKLTGVEIVKMEYPDFKPGPVPEDVRLGLPRRAPRQDPIQKIADRAQPVIPTVATGGAGTSADPAASAGGTGDEISADELARMFPGGIIPKNAPTRNLGSRFRSKRSR